MPNINIPISDELHSALKMKSAREGIVMKKLIPTLLEQILKKEMQK